MRAKASILTILAVILFAGNAFAIPGTSLQVTTDFIGWSTPYGADAAAEFLTFGGSSNWVVDGSSTANSTGGGSMYGYNTGSNSTLKFNRGADEFYFTYTSPTYVTITMADNVFTNPFATTLYANAFWDNYEMVGNETNSITYYLSGSTQWDGVTQSYLDARFAFYANDDDDYLSILSLTFLDYNPYDSSASGDLGAQAVELTNLHYNPTNPTPIPGAAWLLGSGLVGLIGLRRRFKA